MTDIATLGLEVRSTQVETATRSLGSFSGAARHAEAAASGLSVGTNSATAAAARLSGATAQVAASLYREQTATNAATAALRAHAAAANQNEAGIRRGAAGVENLAAQLHDVGVSAAMSMSPLQIALQQGTQISAAFGSMGAAAAVRELGAAFASIITPLSLFILGAVALVAAGLQMVEWTKTAAWALNALADILPAIADEAVLAGAALALAFGPQIISTVVSLTAAIGRGLVAALYAAAAAAYANPYITLAVAFAAVVVAAYHFRDELAEILGYDLVGAVKGAGNVIIGVFIGTFDAAKATWSMLPAAMGDIVYQVADSMLGGMEKMINDSIGLLNDFIKRAEGVLRKLPFGIGEGISIGEVGKVSFGGIENPYPDAAADAAKTAMGALKGAIGPDYLGDLGTGIGAFAKTAAGALKSYSKSLLTSEADTKKAAKSAEDAAKEALRLAEAYDKIVLGAERHIASSHAEAAALGQTAEQAAALKYQTDLLNRAKDAGVEITAAHAAELRGLGAEMASAEAATARAKDALDFAKGATNSFMSEMRSGLKEGEGLWKSFGNAAEEVLKTITPDVFTLDLEERSAA